MKSINYKDAIDLLLDIEAEYKDYCETKNGGLIGGEVGKKTILDNLSRNKDMLQISDSSYFDVCSMCLGITYIENYNDNRNQRMYIPIDYEKLKMYIKSTKNIR